MRHFVLSVVCVLTIILLQGCASMSVDKAAEPVPDLTFAQLKSIPVKVSRIDFATDVDRGAVLWDVANELKTPPNVAMSRYLSKRFRANGTDGVLNVKLTKANVHTDSVPHKNKLLSYVPLANMTEYTFDVVVDLETLYLAGVPNTKTTKRFVRKTRMPLNTTLTFREAKLQKTLEEIMRDIDESLLRTLVYDFGVVSMADVSEHNLPVKTELPEAENPVEMHLRDLKDEAEKVVKKVENTIDENMPQTITPQAVSSEPLNN